MISNTVFMTTINITPSNMTERKNLLYRLVIKSWWSLSARPQTVKESGKCKSSLISLQFLITVEVNSGYLSAQAGDNKWKDWNKENWKYKQWWVIFAILRKDLVKFYQLTLLFQSQSSINEICSLPADVLWGSFVTHSFLPRDKRTPKDVCREAMRYAVYTKQVPRSISLGYQEHPFQR